MSKRIKAFLRAITPTRDFIIGVGMILLFLMVITVLLGGSVLGILFWGWLAFIPILDVIVRRYKEFLNETG